MEFTICIATLGRDSLYASAQFALAVLDTDENIAGELLIVDDRPSGAGDPALYPLHLPSDPRIRVVKGRAMGWTGPARNTGILEAKGDWILFCDDDDFLHPYCIRWLQETLQEAPKADVVVWRAMGLFEHIPPTMVIPPFETTQLRLGLVTNSLCIRKASGLKYGETVDPTWIKPGFENAVRHRSRETMSPNEDFQLLQQAASVPGALVFARHLAYGYGVPPPPHSVAGPLVIL